MCNPPNMPFYSLWCIQGNLRDRESHNSELMPTCQSKISIINFCLASGKDRNNSNGAFFNAQTVLCSWCISPGCQSRFGAGGKIVERRVKKMKLAGRHLVEYTKSQQSCFMWGKLNVVASRRARVRTHTHTCPDAFPHCISSVLVTSGLHSVCSGPTNLSALLVLL